MTEAFDREQRLIELARAGDRHAFDELIQPVLDSAYRVACGVLFDPPMAEDAVQDAALRAWLKLGTFKPGHEFKPWFLTIVLNQCRTVRRGRWWSVLKGIDPAVHAQAAPELDVSQLDLRNELLRLSETDRQLLVMYYYMDLPIEKVARILRITPGAAKVRVHRALKRLRPKLASAPA